MMLSTALSLALLAAAPSPEQQRERAQNLTDARTGDCEHRGNALIALTFSPEAEDKEVATILRDALQESPCAGVLVASGSYFERHPEPGLYDAFVKGLDWAKANGHRDAANRLARAIGATHKPGAFELLRGMVEQQDLAPLIRAGAAVGLGRTGEKKAEPVLRELLKHGDEAAPGAAEGLGVLKDHRAISALTHALDEPKVARAAAEALGQIGSPDAVPALLHAISSRSPDERRVVVESLTRIGTPAISPTLRYLGCFEECEAVRWTAMQYLHQQNEKLPCENSGFVQRLLGRAPPAEKGSTLTPDRAQGIARALADADPNVRRLAAEDLTALHDPSTVKAISAALAKESVSENRKALERALQSAQGGETAFVERLHGKEVKARRDATSDLRSIRYPARQALLTQQLSDSDARVRQIALGAVFDFDDPFCQQDLLPTLTLRKAEESDPSEKAALERAFNDCQRRIEHHQEHGQ